MANTRLSLEEARKILSASGLLEEASFPATVAESTVFSSLAYDSREMTAGGLFFCKGAGFRAEYLSAAVKNGAAGYVAERVHDTAVPGLIVQDVQKAMALLSQAYYDYPRKNLFIIAITGTKGKTTTAYFCKHILQNRAKITQAKTALISTLEYTLDGVTFEKSTLTTPESLDLARMMWEMQKNGVTHLVLEVSSQAWKKSRVFGLDFDVTVFLNISPDHIGENEHPSFEDYFLCKKEIMALGKTLVLNAEADRFAEVRDYAAVAGKPLVLFRSADAAEYRIPMAGAYNRSNAAAARAACLLVGATEAECRAGVEAARVAGRMEQFHRKTGGLVYVDYAHNGESLRQVLSFVRESRAEGRIAVVLGAPGNKGESRRADFARVFDELGDILVLTADDPNFEDPLDIMEEISANIRNPAREVHKEADREKAIALAFGLAAAAADTVIVAGKGADAFQKVNGCMTPYIGDAAVVERLIRAEEERAASPPFPANVAIAEER